MKPLDLIRAAETSLRSRARNGPSDASLRRATSTAYYAVFHHLAREGADLLIGKLSPGRSKPAWLQAYRALDHGRARAQCQNRQVLKKFPKKIEDFANNFVTLQGKRHDADYNPFASFSLTSVKEDIGLARQAIEGFKACAVSDRRAFCAWVLFRSPFP